CTSLGHVKSDQMIHRSSSFITYRGRLPRSAILPFSSLRTLRVLCASALSFLSSASHQSPVTTHHLSAPAASCNAASPVPTPGRDSVSPPPRAQETFWPAYSTLLGHSHH